MNIKSVIVIALILLSATVSLFYFSELTRTEVETRNKIILAEFRTLNLIHTSIEKDILSLHANKIKNFDSITKSQSVQRTTLVSLKKEAKLLLGDDYATLAGLLSEYQNSYEQTIPLIDIYIRNLSFTKNSLNYSTHLSGQILENLSDENNRGAKEKLNHLVADVLQYLINGSNHNEKVISKHIQELQAHLTNNNDSATAAFKTLSKHLKMVLHGNQTKNSNLEKTLSSPHPHLLEASYRHYLKKEQSALQRHQLYSNLSIFCSLLLALFILHAIYKLITNAGKLSQEKTQLEESVTENRESLHRTNQKLKREIEQRIHAEDGLKDAAILYQHCSEGVIICDKNKKTISVNPAFSTITGITAEKVIGHTPKIFDPAEIPKDVYDEMLHALSVTGKWRGEVDTTSTHGLSPKEVSVISLKKQGLIHRYIVIIVDISERKKHEETIYLQANYDPLTKLPNRNLFNERAEQTLARAQRNNSRFATLFIDLDNFKKINDNLGHSVGDELLAKLALRLSDAIRETDTVSRFGGDEFIILIDNISHRHELKKVIKKLIQCLSTPVITSIETLHTSGSIGISVYPDDGADISTLIRCADMSMYKAKAQGKNTYCFFENKMNIEIHEYLAMENQLRSAVANQELLLEYQPIINPFTNKVYATEALVRWNRGSEGRVPPDKFIPIAEESGLIVPIGEWILRAACTQLADWNQHISADLKMSVNISTLQFKDDDFDKMLLSVIKETGANPLNLNLEITESLFLEDRESHIFTTLQDLRTQGISISLDDFGTGYSSLSYLKHFPINVLKIDRSFITDIVDDQSDQLLVKAIISMAQGLNINVVAEGVETKQQCELLIDYQCDYIQGYYFSKPLSAWDLQFVLSQPQKLTGASL